MSHTKWIPITNTLPEIGKYVLVLIGNTWFKGRLMNNGWAVTFADGEKLASEPRPVTHFSYMPEELMDLIEE